ncbi:hypothetical protein QQF64_009554, partial [Cirrhinus molitorella]
RLSSGVTASSSVVPGGWVLFVLTHPALAVT